MRTRSVIVAPLFVASLVACKSLPMGSFNLLNTPAMSVAKITPTINVPDADKLSFAADGKIAGMAISGGGMRASAFTLGIFAGLQEIKGSDGRSALDIIDFASANSGGSWALAALLTDRRTRPGFAPKNEFESYADRFKQLNDSRTKHWARAMQDMLGSSVTMADVGIVRPLAFFNASLLPSQDPFVFTQDFADRYKIAGFYARGSDGSFGTGGSVASLPLGYVTATSGSVPGFTHSYAETNFCTSAEARPSFCGTKMDGGWLRLVDGGLYDNAAYKTAWEVARASLGPASPAGRAMLLIDAKNGWPVPATSEDDARDHDGLLKAGGSLLFKGSFPNQESTYRRLAPQMFDAIGYRTVLLDFDAAAGFSEPSNVPLDGLEQLFDMAAYKIDCVTDEGIVVEAKSKPANSTATAIERLRDRGGDCLANNLARVGYRHKTTYYFDREFFAATYQLGVYVARRRANDIKAALGMQ